MGGAERKLSSGSPKHRKSAQRCFWEVPAELQAEFSDAAVILKAGGNVESLRWDPIFLLQPL